IDAFDALRLATITYDPLRSTLFLMRQVRAALEAGEPTRVLQALIGLCTLHASHGSERRSDDLLAQAAALADRLGTPEARAALCAGRAYSSWLLGRPTAVLEPAHEAEQLFRTLAQDRFEGSYYTRLAIVSARMGALFDLGELRTLAREVRRTLQE